MRSRRTAVGTGARENALGAAMCVLAHSVGPEPSRPIEFAESPGAAAADLAEQPPSMNDATAAPTAQESITPIPSTARGEDVVGGGRAQGPFAQQRLRLSLLVGTSSTINSTYMILGAGVGYFLFDGVEVGLEYQVWLLGDPVLQTLSPEARYVFHFVPVLKPYVGLFYRHTFVAGLDDFDTLGARGGVFYVPPDRPVYVGAGAAYERFLDCSSDALVNCNAVYPEILVGISL